MQPAMRLRYLATAVHADSSGYSQRWLFGQHENWMQARIVDCAEQAMLLLPLPPATESLA